MPPRRMPGSNVEGRRRHGCRPADNFPDFMPTLRDMLATAPWAKALPDARLASIEAETSVRECPAGSLVCRKGERVEHWIGVDRGSGEDGERVRRREGDELHGHRHRRLVRRRLAAEGRAAPLRHRRAARLDDRLHAAGHVHGAPRRERRVQPVPADPAQRAARTVHRPRRARPAAGPGRRLARGLASLFNPHLYPGSRSTLPISQEELGQLVGLSRQRVNQALQILEKKGLLRVEYAGVTVLDLKGLREFDS